MSPRATAVLGLALIGCAIAPASAPPLGEVLIVVDTDLTIPKLASRLRIDLYTPAGTWIATRDVALPKPSDWPTSFGVALREGESERRVVVRLRAYPEGYVRDYRGERYQERPSGGNDFDVVPEPAATPGPRLLDASGTDITPGSEPQPLVTVDRLILVRIRQDVLGSTRVVLHGACEGTMADLRDFTALATCNDTEATQESLADAIVQTDLAMPPTAQGSFEAPYATDCTITPRTPTPGSFDDEACVRGGAFIFGTADFASGGAADDFPARVALVPSFLMDRYEVTVGRFRAPGIFNGDLTANNGALSGLVRSTSACTFTSAAGARENLPVNCLREAVAADFCAHLGADLPTEVEWEYAATGAFRPRKTHFPTGDSPLGCVDEVFGRSSDPSDFAPSARRASDLNPRTRPSTTAATCRAYRRTARSTRWREACPR